MEDNNNVLAEVLGSLVNNKDNNNFTGNGGFMWIIFMFFMFFWGGNGNNGFWGNRGNGFLSSSSAWEQTQDGIRDVLNAVHTSNAPVMNALNGIDSDIRANGNMVTQLGYNLLEQSNATNQQLAQQGFNLQAAIMAGNNLLNNAINQASGDTRLAICQSGNATQNAIKDVGYGTQTAVYQTANQTQNAVNATSGAIQNTLKDIGFGTQTAIYQTANQTQNAINGTGNAIQNSVKDLGFGTQNAIYQTANQTQRLLQDINGDTKLAICQSTNGITNAINGTGNNLQNSIQSVGNQTLQGLTGLGFLTQQKTDEIKYELAKSTNAITANETCNTQKVLDKLCQMEAGMQAQRIQELQVQNQALILQNQVKDLQAGQLANTGFIINQLRPYPVPAYTVSSPYGTTTTTTNP